MFSQLQCFLLPAVISLVVGDYYRDISGQAAAYNNYNTYYPDYSYAYNNSVADSRKRRVFTDDYTLSKMFFSFYKFIFIRFQLRSNQTSLQFIKDGFHKLRESLKIG